MKILLCLDSFKGSLPAAEACAAAAAGIRRVDPEAALRLRPLADGGEGTAATILQARGGDWIPARVTGPLPGMPVEAGYAWFPDEQAALVEMAAASGLTLLPPDARDPLRTTTLGTGELIAAALARGAKRIDLAIGGSATCDGGVGAARALGWQFLDSSGQAIPDGGGGLIDLARVVAPTSPRRLPPVRVWCDVDNPLIGPRGAAAVFGPQKGATPAMVGALDRGLDHLADVCAAMLDCDMRTLPGAGAAGGLGGGAVAFLGASLVSGIDAVLDWIGFDEDAAWADWVWTGEGCVDASSLGGKVISGVVRRAPGRVALLAGDLALPESAWRAAGFSAARGARPADLSVQAAMDQAYPLLADAAEMLLRGIHETH